MTAFPPPETEPPQEMRSAAEITARKARLMMRGDFMGTFLVMDGSPSYEF
jgi:hypothetical protein